MSKVAYVRVSTAEQNEARQREALAVRGIDKWFIEKASGKNTDRPEFQKMLDWVREGDTIYIHDLSRIARSTKDLLDLLDVLREKGVALVSDKESIDTSTATGKLLVTMVAAINEFERANLLERQREGIAIAKREAWLFPGCPFPQSSARQISGQAANRNCCPPRSDGSGFQRPGVPGPPGLRPGRWGTGPRRGTRPAIGAAA